MEREIKRKFVLTRAEIEIAIFDWMQKHDIPLPTNANMLSIVHQDTYLDDVEVSWDTKDTFEPEKK
jgi:hypothetical protein